MTDDKKEYRIVLLITLCLILAIVAVYAKVQKYDFVGYDDELYVTQNQYVQKGISSAGVKWAFTTFHTANWHPLTWLSHMLDCELYGLDPGGHHWTNVEFHIANTVLLFFILFRMTGALWRSAFAAALFALHPLHVESVAWVSERKDVLSTFFGLLSIAAYDGYVKKSSTAYYLLAFILLCLGLMAKPMLVTLPFVLLLLDIWPLNRFQLQRGFPTTSKKFAGEVVRRNYRIILEKILFLIPVVLSCIITFLAQKSEDAVKPIAALSLKYRIENAVVSYVKYVLKAIWPQKLAIFYPHPGSRLHLWQAFGGALLILAAGYVAIRTAKKYPYILVGLFWYLGTLIPVIGLVQVGDQAMADRYTYIPLIGIFIIVSWGISEFFKERRFQKIVLGILAAFMLVALSWESFFQLNTWRNGITLFSHAVSVTRNNYIAENNLGTAYGSKDLNKAFLHYQAALKINPKYAAAQYNLGTIYEKKGQMDEAISCYLKALKTKPDSFGALNNLGVVFYHQGNYDKAVFYFKKALETKPTKTEARINFANMLFALSKPDDAVSEYQEILRIDPENADAHFNLAYILSTQNKIDEAVHHYDETLRIDPKYSKAYYFLGNILLNRRKPKGAVLCFAKAIEFSPNYVQAYNKIGCILLMQGKFRKAGVFFSKALQFDPDFSEARANLDAVKRFLQTEKTKGSLIGDHD